MINEAEYIEHIIGIIMDKTCSLKVGLERFGEKGEHAVSSELTQLHDMYYFHLSTPVNYQERT